MRRKYLFLLAAHKLFHFFNRQRTVTYVGKKAVDSNIHIFNKYGYFFGPAKESLRIYVAIELAKLFEDSDLPRNKNPKHKKLTVEQTLRFLETNINNFNKKEIERRYKKEHKVGIASSFEEISSNDIKKIRRRIKNNFKKIKAVNDFRDHALAHNDLVKTPNKKINSRDVTTLLNIVEDVVDLIYLKLTVSSNSYRNFRLEPIRHLDMLMKDLKQYDKDFRASFE